MALNSINAWYSPWPASRGARTRQDMSVAAIPAAGEQHVELEREIVHAQGAGDDRALMTEAPDGQPDRGPEGHDGQRGHDLVADHARRAAGRP